MRLALPSWPARNPVEVKMPVPTMFDTTSAVALTMPSWRRSDGFSPAPEPGENRPWPIADMSVACPGRFRDSGAGPRQGTPSITDEHSAGYVTGGGGGEEQRQAGQLV